MYEKIDGKVEAPFGNTRMKQGSRPIQLHISESDSYASQMQIDDEGLTRDLMEGLDEKLTDELLDQPTCTFLDSIRSIASKVEQCLEEGRREEQDGDRGYTSYIGNHIERPEVPMKLDATVQKRSGKLSQKDREYRVENDLCLCCGNGGRQAKERNSPKWPTCPDLCTIKSEEEDEGLMALSNFTVNGTDE